jgi:hypothetical protein
VYLWLPHARSEVSLQTINPSISAVAGRPEAGRNTKSKIVGLAAMTGLIVWPRSEPRPISCARVDLLSYRRQIMRGILLPRRARDAGCTLLSGVASVAEGERGEEPLRSRQVPCFSPHVTSPIYSSQTRVRRSSDSSTNLYRRGRELAGCNALSLAPSGADDGDARSAPPTLLR